MSTDLTRINCFLFTDVFMSVQQGIVSEPSGTHSTASPVDRPPEDWTDSKKKQY